MTYSSQFVYVRANGHLGANSATMSERWTSGLKILHGGPAPSTGDLLAFLTAIAPAYSTFHGSTAVKAGTTAFLDNLTAAVIGTDGKYVGGGAQPTTVYTYGTPTQGNGAGVMPWSTAIVISLRTQFSRGYASNGRMYWPTQALTIDSTNGQWAPATTLGVANAAKTLLDAINTASSTGFDSTHKVAVMSNVGGGQAALVTKVRVGSKPDRQERREKDLVEIYSQVNLATATVLQDEFDQTPVDRLGGR